MPRRQPPKGYYRATEVEKLLGISSAMVRIYVQQGKIKYLIPEGMKQGYYLKSDVERLVRIRKGLNETASDVTVSRPVIEMAKGANFLLSLRITVRRTLFAQSVAYCLSLEASSSVYFAFALKEASYDLSALQWDMTPAKVALQPFSKL